MAYVIFEGVQAFRERELCFISRQRCGRRGNRIYEATVDAVEHYVPCAVRYPMPVS